MTTIVRYINVRGETTERAIFSTGVDENCLDRLEEILYIMWELEPVSRDWRYNLYNYGFTTFNYHGTNDCIVRVSSLGKEVTVTETGE